MQPKEIFHLAIRLLGLIFLGLAMYGFPHIDGARSFFIVLCEGGAAWWFIGGVPQLEDRAYPESSEE